MKTSFSFERTIGDYNFIFARIVSEEDIFDQYSVMTGDTIFRMVRNGEENPFVFENRDDVPGEVLEMEQELSDTLLAAPSSWT